MQNPNTCLGYGGLYVCAWEPCNVMAQTVRTAAKNCNNCCPLGALLRPRPSLGGGNGTVPGAPRSLRGPAPLKEPTILVDL